jgi:NAD(P)-dependent dehydrogenase (short-subunit alcohol dehydrogenase family)
MQLIDRDRPTPAAPPRLLAVALTTVEALCSMAAVIRTPPATQHRLRRIAGHVLHARADAAASATAAGSCSSEGRLAGKVAVISGAGGGIGRETALVFAREGATVFGCGRTLATLEETRDLVVASGGSCSVLAADVSVEEQCQAVIETATATYGRLDILVNNAGVGYEYGAANPGGMDPLLTTPTPLWKDVIDINLTSVYLFSKYAIPAMIESGARGAIVNVGSAAGSKGGTDAHAYAVSKAGMNSITKSMAKTYFEPHGADNT